MNGKPNNGSAPDCAPITYCKRCGRLLTDPDSVKRGYGAICYALLARENKEIPEPVKFGGLDLDELADLIDSKKPVCICGEPLQGSGLKTYPHEGGEIVYGKPGRQWVYVHCKKCGYDMALHKIKRELTRV